MVTMVHILGRFAVGLASDKTRESKGSLRTTGGAYIVLISTLLLSACVAPAATAPSPAAVTTPSPEVMAYQAMTGSDERSFSVASHSACNTTQDTSCPAAIVALMSATQRWRDDLDRSLVPELFAPVQAEMRQNMTRLISDLNAMQAAFQAHDQGRLDLARNAGAAVDQLIDYEGNDIVNAHQATTALYRGLVHSQVTQLHDCGLCQAILTQRDGDCIGDVASCMGNLETTRTMVEEMQGSLVQMYAPSGLGGKEASLQAELTSADAAVTQMTAVLNAGGSQADLAAARQVLVTAVGRFVSDASTI
jgi:hypothetical protein